MNWHSECWLSSDGRHDWHLRTHNTFGPNVHLTAGFSGGRHEVYIEPGFSFAGSAFRQGHDQYALAFPFLSAGSGKDDIC